MSTQELRARIVELSNAIHLQRELLKKLENEKSLVQRELNAALDPFARLPLELSSDIFLRCLPAGDHPKPDATRAPMLFLHVCNAWKSIAISVPALWTSIEVDLPCAAGAANALQNWLQRASNHLLSISLRGRFRDKGVAGVVWRHGHQLKHLHLCDDVIDGEGDNMDLTGGIPPGPLPSLETLTVRGQLEGRDVKAIQILQLLRLAPNVSQCILHGLGRIYNITPVAQKVVFPALRGLMFGEEGTNPNCDDDLLKHLSLPSLATLSLGMRDVSSDDLMSFLKRSSPPLQELVIGHGRRAELSRLEDCFRLIPSLISFRLWWPRTTLIAHLFTVLADSPSLLPNLQRLFIHNSYNLPDSFWTIVLRMLLARRSRFKEVSIQITAEGPVIPTETLEALRELAADGMQIYIGTGSGAMYV
ncbi:hypothetical protein DFH06DRAFT_1470068 [Mycena polygramma]|nr:hypothetical protein DFH06DRAFT_1470068 [Mycena polygramma]